MHPLDDVFLDQWNLLLRDFHPQIAARNHDCIGHRPGYLPRSSKCLRLLNFRNDPRVLARLASIRLRRSVMSLEHSGRTKAQPSPHHCSKANAKSASSFSVMHGSEIAVEGKLIPFAWLQFPAVNDLTFRTSCFAVRLQDFQFQLAIVHEHRLSRRHIPCKLLDRLCRPRHFLPS